MRMLVRAKRLQAELYEVAIMATRLTSWSCIWGWRLVL